MTDRRPRITVYTRQGCHLCEDAIAIVRRVAAGRGDIDLVDIDGDPELFERYTVRVPVVAVDDVEIAEYQIAPEQLEWALR
ncbi:MAG TPA: glutaredoxin family protein [Euzebyales bacterium]